MKRNRKMLAFLLVFIIVALSACQNPKEPIDTANTAIKEIFLPFKFDFANDIHESQKANAKVFWLHDEVVLIVRENALGCSYDIFDWEEENIIVSGDLVLQYPPIESQVEQVSWVQLNQNQFYVKNLFESTEAYLWECNDNGDIVIQPMTLPAEYVYSSVNQNVSIIAGVLKDREVIETYRIHQGSEIGFRDEESLTTEALSVPEFSMLTQIAFLNSEVLVYGWNSTKDRTKSGYGLYSITDKMVISQNFFGSSDMVVGKDSVMIVKTNLEQQTPEEFVFISSNGESQVIKDTPLNNRFGSLLNAFVAGDYVGKLTSISHSPSLIYTWTLMNPLSMSSFVELKVDPAKTENSIITLSASEPFIAFSQDKKPIMIFYNLGYSSGYRNGVNPDKYALYIVSLLGGLDRPISGDIKINGKSIVTLSEDQLAVMRRKSIGYVFQFFNLIPHLSALENVELPMKITGASRKEARERAEYLLNEVGLSPRAHHRPDQLSGGEQQRVAIARSLINKPAVVLADEPTGNLDSKTRDIVISLFQKFREIENQTFVIITHDTGLTQYAQRVVRLRDGKVESVVVAS